MKGLKSSLQLFEVVAPKKKCWRVRGWIWLKRVSNHRTTISNQFKWTKNSRRKFRKSKRINWKARLPLMMRWEPWMSYSSRPDWMTFIRALKLIRLPWRKRHCSSSTCKAARDRNSMRRITSSRSTWIAEEQQLVLAVAHSIRSSSRVRGARRRRERG